MTPAEALATLERTRRRLAWLVRHLHLNPRPLPDWVGDVETLEE
jgi:hypothetical protein